MGPYRPLASHDLQRNRPYLRRSIHRLLGALAAKHFHERARRPVAASLVHRACLAVDIFKASSASVRVVLCVVRDTEFGNSGYYLDQASEGRICLRAGAPT